MNKLDGLTQELVPVYRAEMMDEAILTGSGNDTYGAEGSDNRLSEAYAACRSHNRYPGRWVLPCSPQS
ncbi:MAG: hypothetical protein ACYTEQ_04000 [Planctomycetota bacterium]